MSYLKQFPFLKYHHFHKLLFIFKLVRPDRFLTLLGQWNYDTIYIAKLDMITTVILDGYNLIHSRHFPGYKGRSLEDKRDYLIHLIRQYATQKRLRCIIVFDSKMPFSRQGKTYHRVEVRFSPPHKEADHVIQEMIRKSKNPPTILVVSSDRAIQHTAKVHGASAMSSETFWDEEAAFRPSMPTTTTIAEGENEKPDANLSDEQVQEWLDLFSREDDEDA